VYSHARKGIATRLLFHSGRWGLYITRIRNLFVHENISSFLLLHANLIRPYIHPLSKSITKVFNLNPAYLPNSPSFRPNPNNMCLAYLISSMVKGSKAKKAEEGQHPRTVDQQPGAQPQMQTSGVPAPGYNGGGRT